MKKREANKGTRALLAHGYENLQSKIIGMADVFLPNSESEMHRVASEFPAHLSKPYVVVPNAVDAELFDARRGPVSEEAEELKGPVLCVGRAFDSSFVIHSELPSARRRCCDPHPGLRRPA